MAQGTGEPGIGKLSGMKRSRKPRKRSWIRRLLLILIVIGAIPVALTIFYLPPFIHPVSTLMAKDLVTLRGFTREWKPLSEISPRLVNSVMMSEDGQFCAHHGIDLGEFRAVLQDFMEGEPSRGGSTITMQTAKNLYLWHGRSYVRKAIELPYAVFLDAIMPKRRIMEIYLNIVEWGPGIYGAEAAAQHHFGKSASNLTAREAALLAVTLPNPIARTPGKPTAALNRLASRIERRARQAGGYNHCVR